MYCKTISSTEGFAISFKLWLVISQNAFKKLLNCWKVGRFYWRRRKLILIFSNIINFVFCLYLSLNIQNFCFKVNYDTCLSQECWYDFENTIVGFFSLLISSITLWWQQIFLVSVINTLWRELTTYKSTEDPCDHSILGQVVSLSWLWAVLWGENQKEIK